MVVDEFEASSGFEDPLDIHNEVIPSTIRDSQCEVRHPHEIEGFILEWQAMVDTATRSIKLFQLKFLKYRMKLLTSCLVPTTYWMLSPEEDFVAQNSLNLEDQML